MFQDECFLYFIVTLFFVCVCRFESDLTFNALLFSVDNIDNTAQQTNTRPRCCEYIWFSKGVRQIVHYGGLTIDVDTILCVS